MFGMILSLFRFRKVRLIAVKDSEFLRLKKKGFTEQEIINYLRVKYLISFISFFILVIAILIYKFKSIEFIFIIFIAYFLILKLYEKNLEKK